MVHPISKLTRKCQATIPLPVRKALGLKAGDAIAFDVEDGEVRLRKAGAVDLAFARAVEGTLEEWNSAEDEDAYREL
jgi:AbrB family looped-hinge helix DNA binding protein